jgi:ADP-ribose pyrophosphatase YjhB (NUDIX family)
MLMIFRLTYDLVTESGEIKALAIAEAKAKEAEVARDARFIDEPLATMQELFHPAFTIVSPNRDEEEFVLWEAQNSDDQNVIRCQTHHMFFNRGKTTRLTAHRTWGAFTKVRELVMKHGASEYDFQRIAPVLFPWTYGVQTMLRRYDSNKVAHLLVVIRNKEITGERIRTVGFPGGLVRANENIELTARRQMHEECGIVLETIESGVTFGIHQNAPITTFVCLATSISRDVSSSFELNDGKAVWVTEETVKKALDDDTDVLVDAFRTAGIDVNHDIQFSQDVVVPARLLLNHVYPAQVCLL